MIERVRHHIIKVPEMFGHNDSGFNTTIEVPVHYAWCGSGRKGGGERGKLEIDSAGKVR
jgi:hypothetical protein